MNPKILFWRKIMLVFCCVILMTSLLGVEAQAGRLSMPSGANLAAPDAPDVSITHSTVADFDQICAVKTNAHISDNLTGSVELAGALSDNFDGTTLDSTRWVSGSWDPPTVYTPVVSGGKLTVPAGGYVRSNTAVFTRGVMDAKVEFTKGEWQQVGFGNPGLASDPRYLFFSTLNTSGITTTLYARTGLFDYHDELLGLVPTGTHQLKINWLAYTLAEDYADFYFDGNLVYESETFTSTVIANSHLWMSNNGATNIIVDEIQVAPPYAASGSYVSCPVDATAGNLWQTVSWVTAIPADTTLTVQTRTSADGLTWTTPWSTVAMSGGAIASPNRYVEYQILLGTSNVNATAALDSITFNSGTTSADLSLTKTVSNATPDVGQPVDFTVTVNNAGPSAATNVEVKDALQTGFTFSSATATLGTYDNATGIWTVGTVPSAGNAVLTLRAVVNATGNYSNVAEVSKSEVSDPDSTPNNGIISEDDYKTLTVVPIPVADLELAKVAQSTTPVIGSTQVFTVTLTNKGPSVATGVKVKDLLESGYQFTAASAGPGTYDQNTGEWTVSTLALNQSVNLRLTSTIKPTGTYNNYAQVIASNEKDSDSTPNDNSTTQDDDASVTISAVPGADLSLTKQASKIAPYVGESVVFTVAVTNAGPAPATGVIVKDLLNSGYTFISSTQPGTYEAQTGMWNVGTLQASESKQLAITVQVKSTGNYQNVAEVWESALIDPDSTPGNGVIAEDDYGTVTPSPVPAADLSIVKTLITTNPEPGKPVIFQIRVINSGPSSAGGVTIRDAMPANHVFVSSDHTAVYNSVERTLTWDLGTIPASQEVVIQLTLQANGSGSYTNQVQVMTSNVYDPDSVPGNSVLSEDDLSSVQYSVKTYIYLPFIVKNP